MKLLRHVVLAASAVLLTVSMQSTQARAQDSTGCEGVRVRKAWRMFSDDEKRIYTDALQSAMTSHEFFEFTKVHVHRMSEPQAHDTCAFMIWHKRYLLAFENMLRAQTPESRCLTVPYWDAMTQYSQMVDGQCGSIYECAAIVRELGGADGPPPSDKKEKVTVNGRAVTGQCYAASSAYCDDDKSVCGCVPRADLRSASMPATSGFQGLFDQIAFSSDFETFSRVIQVGIHNDMHSALGGFMATFYSPNDMLFWSWHATIDMLLYVYHQCHLAESMTADDLRSSIYAFSQDGYCKYDDDAPDAVVGGTLIQKSEYHGQDYDSTDHPVIGKYFQGLPTDIGALLGFDTLGDASYTYQIPEAFKKFLLLKDELCPAFTDAQDQNPMPPVETPPASETQAPAPVEEEPVSASPPPAEEKRTDQDTQTPAMSLQASEAGSGSQAAEQAYKIDEEQEQQPEPESEPEPEEKAYGWQDEGDDYEPGTVDAGSDSNDPLDGSTDNGYGKVGYSEDPNVGDEDGYDDGYDWNDQGSETPTLEASQEGENTPAPDDYTESPAPSEGDTPVPPPPSDGEGAPPQPEGETPPPPPEGETPPPPPEGETPPPPPEGETPPPPPEGENPSPPPEGENPPPPPEGENLPPPPEGETQSPPPEGETAPPPPPPGGDTPVPTAYVDPALLQVDESDPSLLAGKYWAWVDTARARLNELFPGNHTEVAAQLQYLECLSFNEQFGVQNFTEEFIRDFKLPEDHQRPECLKKIDEVETGAREVVVCTEKFTTAGLLVKPGVTPAPPVPPRVRPTHNAKAATSSAAVAMPQVSLALQGTVTALVAALLAW